MFYNLIVVIQHHCVMVLNLILVPVKEHLHGRTFGMNDSLKGGLTFRKQKKPGNAFGGAWGIEKPSRFEVWWATIIAY